MAYIVHSAVPDCAWSVVEVRGLSRRYTRDAI